MIIPKINFPIYGIIIVLSVIIGFAYIFFSLKKDKFKDSRIFLFFFLALVFVFVFAKMYSYITNYQKISFIKAGLSSYGGLIGLIVASIYFEFLLPSDKKIVKYSILSLPLIYGLSKLACAVVGCCGGLPYDGFGYVIYRGVMNIPQVPIQFMEVITFLIIFLLCNRFKNYKYISYVTLIVTVLGKFLLDFLRYDHVSKIITVNQVFSIILIVITLIVLIVNKKKVTSK